MQMKFLIPISSAILIFPLFLFTPPGRAAPDPLKSTKAEPVIETIEPPQHGFLAKQCNYRGLPIKSGIAVSDGALQEAWRRLAKLLDANPVILQNLRSVGVELQIIGRDQMTSDLPYLNYWKGKPFDGNNDIDKRTRGISDLFASCGEENLLKLTTDRYLGRDICSHEFTHTIHHYGLSMNVFKEIERQYRESTGKGLWEKCYAAANSTEYIAEMVMWYLGGRGDWPRSNSEMKSGPEWLKGYDPKGYDLIHRLVTGKFKVKPVIYRQLKLQSSARVEKIIWKAGNLSKYAAVVFDNRTNQDWLCCYFNKEGRRIVYNKVLAHDRMGADSCEEAVWVVLNPKDESVRASYVVTSDHCRVVLKD